MVYGCSKGHISLVIEFLLKEEFLVGLSASLVVCDFSSK